MQSLELALFITVNSELRYKNKLTEPDFKVASWFISTASSQLAMPLAAVFRITILYCIADDKYTTGIILINCNRRVNLLKICCSVCKDGKIRTAYQL
jgi:hypothetical protein